MSAPHMWVVSKLEGERETPVGVAISEQDAVRAIREADPTLRLYRPRPADPDFFVFRTRGADWMACYSAQRVPVVPGADWVSSEVG